MQNSLQTAVFDIVCKGRDASGQEVLQEPVAVDFLVRVLENRMTVAMSVNCPHNTGGHGQRCKASHPSVDKVGEEGISCPYAIDLR